MTTKDIYTNHVMARSWFLAFIILLALTPTLFFGAGSGIWLGIVLYERAFYQMPSVGPFNTAVTPALVLLATLISAGGAVALSLAKLLRPSIFWSCLMLAVAPGLILTAYSGFWLVSSLWATASPPPLLDYVFGIAASHVALSRSFRLPGWRAAPVAPWPRSPRWRCRGSR